jgi:hypothetical protein
MTQDSRIELIKLVGAFLKDANGPLIKHRVIPPSVYKTYLRVGTDFEGHYLMSLDSYKALENSLARMFPEIFSTSEVLVLYRHPSMYLPYLITRAIDITDWSTDSTLGDDLVVGRLADELIETLSNSQTSLLKAREVSHLETENNEILKIKNLEIRPTVDLRGSMDSIQWVESQIRGAFADWDKRMSFSIERPLALVTQDIHGEWDYVDEHYSDSSKQIGQFILACQLTYNATIRNYWEVMGSPDPMSPYRPSHFNFKDYDGFISLIRKTASIQKTHIPGIEWLINEIDFILSKPELKVATSLEIGLSNFSKSFYSGKNIRAIADLATCLESIMIQGSTTEISLKLRSRTAALIYTESDPIQKLYDDIKNLYDLRSILIHGGAIDEKQLIKILNQIVSRSDVSTSEKLALAVYRFHDIVRRALLSRITLSSMENSPWSKENENKIDALLADAQFRELCRESIRQKLREAGLEFAIEKSPDATVIFVDSDR